MSLRVGRGALGHDPSLYQLALNETHSGDSQGLKSLNQWGELIWRFTMGGAIALREDFNGPALRRLAKASKDAGQSRRLLALAEIYDGGRRTDAARTGSVGLQVVRDWVLRFNAKGPEGLIDGKSTGKPPKLNVSQRRALAEIVESGPITAIHGVVRWRLADLAQWIFEEFRVSLDCSTVSRELRALGFRKISARPRHRGQNEFAVEDFKKTFPPSWRKSAPASRPTPS
jgi:transposase